MKRETWYVMEDGSLGDPREIGHDNDGNLAHKDGRKVAYAPHGPRSRGVDVGAERLKKAPPTSAAPTAAATKPPTEAPPASEKRELKPEEPKRTYKTRESKGD